MLFKTKKVQLGSKINMADAGGLKDEDVREGKTRFLNHERYIELHTENFGDIAHPACLLISGALAPARFWSDVFCERMAARGFFVIRYDHRDIGESHAVDWNKEPYTLSDLAKDALGILDAYRIEKAYFVGHSMGGHICQQIAIDFPQRVLKLALISSGPIGVVGEESPLTLEEKAILNTTWKVFLAPKKDQMEGFFLVWRYLNGEYLFDEERAKSYTQDLLTRTKHEIKAGNNHELLMGALKKELNGLEKIHAPTLVIHGQKDPLALPREGRALAEAIPGARLIMIPKMGHMFFNQDLELKIANLLVECFESKSIPKSKEPEFDF